MSDTDTADEVIDISYTPPKKRAKKLHFSVSEKQIILNIYKYEMQERNDLSVEEIVCKVAMISGYKKRGRNSLLLEKEEIVIWRREYLRKIKKFRAENRKIYFLDETWVNAGHTQQKVWLDSSVKSSRQAFMDGLSTGLKNPSVFNRKKSFLGKGKRLIICHIGSVDGFVPDALWAFESKKTGDYHEEMDGASFENWFSNTLSKIPHEKNRKNTNNVYKKTGNSRMA
nr:unnamed protein product [Callosobruchus chinensis]